MGRGLPVAVSRLGRTGTSTIAFLAVLVPYYSRTTEIWPSIGVAAPLFVMSMCTFILNDINDIERDRVNHPERPLPQGWLSIRAAAAVYLFLFVSSLVAVRELVPMEAHFVYLGGFLLAINYSTVVNNIAVLKSLYVAAVATTPILIVNSLLEERLIHWSIWLAAFLFIFGREILMDIQDCEGDGQTLAKLLGSGPAGAFASLIQGIGIIALAPSVDTPARAASWASIFFLALVVGLWWRRPHRRAAAIHLMKAQFLLALVFLV